MQNVPSDVCASSDPGFQTRLKKVPALYIFTQYEADFKQENASKAFGPINVHLPQSGNFLEERVNMHICICLPMTPTGRNINFRHHS